MAACSKCQKEQPAEDLLETLCADCIFKLAQFQTSITREKLLKAREMIETETAGLMHIGDLREILDELLDHIDAGEARDDALTRASNAIQRLGAINVCKEMKSMAQSLEKVAQGLHEEAKKKERVLTSLRKEK